MTNDKNNINLEDFKYLIDSRTLTDKEKEAEKETLLQAREARYRQRTQNEIKAAKLLQLKLQMEDYVNESADQGSFSEFLKRYIDILYNTQKDFASDMNVTPINISHLVNQHREPQSSFLNKLILHSEETYSEICDFSMDLWPKVFYQDRLIHFMAENKEMAKIEKENVKGRVIKLAEG